MLAEWIAYLTTPCPRHLRAMGYLKGLIGLEARYRRCGKAWAPHLENTKAAILEAARSCPAKRRAVVMGSGPLFDVPLAELSALFDEVVLADIFHMPKARRMAGAYANVRLLTQDLTGIAEALFEQSGPLPRPPPGGLPLEGADLAVSANLLSQLPHLPREYLAKCGRDGGGIDALSRSIIENHLAALADFNGVACIVAETERLITDGDEVIEAEDALHGVRLPETGRQWIWDIAPPPEMDRRYGLKMRIAAIADTEVRSR